MSNLKSNVGLCADFDVDVRKIAPDGSVVSTRRALSGCKNLITNFGMDQFGYYHIWSVMAFLSVGEGNATPAFTDTELEDKVAVVGPGGVGDHNWYWDPDSPNDTLIYRRVYTFAVGAAAGALKELGLSVTSSGGLTTRALFKDAFGDPTTVDVDSDEQLIVTYRLHMKASTAASVLVKVVNGVEYTLTLLFSNLGQVAGLYSFDSYGIFSPCAWVTQTYSYNTYSYYGPGATVGTPTTEPIGTSWLSDSPPNTRTPYVPGSYAIEDALTFGTAQFVGNDLGAVYFYNGFPFKTQLGISPRLNKTAIDTVKFTMRLSWSRL